MNSAPNFSLAIKKSNTDEWYTTRDAVELIVPYLEGGGIGKSFAPLIQRKASS